MDFSVSLSVSVIDPATLWLAAAEVAMAAPGMTLDDVIATIGSEHDPEIANCIAMLLQPAQLTGCDVQALTLHPVAPGASDHHGVATLHANQPGTPRPTPLGVNFLRRVGMIRPLPPPRPSKCA